MANRKSTPTPGQILKDVSNPELGILILKLGDKATIHASALGQDEFDLLTSVIRGNEELIAFFFDACLSVMDEENPGIVQMILKKLATKYSIQ